MAADLKDYMAFLAEVAEETGNEAFKAVDEEGLVALTVDESFTLNLQFVAAASKVLCFAPVCTLPPEASRELYRELLVAGLFGQETAGGFFALEPESETVVYNYLVDFDPQTLSPKAFERLLEKILGMVELWRERLAQRLEATPELPMEPPTADAIFHP